MSLLNRLFRKKSGNENFYPRGPWLIEVGDIFLCKGSFGKRINVDPKTIRFIKIITNDKGPFSDDLFWKFECENIDFYLASESPKAPEFMSMFQELNGFDNEQLALSASSAENASFVVWDRKAL
ncbi:hypothetical protein [Thalassotalea sp. Y01]|uniref:hypothetical protein n=1 Tax=Thalassotalea sp. Y01 TaxID=2729613 RepID=UPI00145F9863|nr:hypothetical protein [Thalassotalea sp. Y01]NMP16345.1 hypothetical protein [Thalassotalea sp. Y01]